MRGAPQAYAMNVTIETTDDPALIVELLREVQQEHRMRRPGWFKPFA